MFVLPKSINNKLYFRFLCCINNACVCVVCVRVFMCVCAYVCVCLCVYVQVQYYEQIRKYIDAYFG